MTNRNARRAAASRDRNRPPHLAQRPSLTRNGIGSDILVQLAFERIAEAKILLREDRFSGAAYIVGYGVELLLKSVIASRNRGGMWPVEHLAPDMRVHDLEELMRSAGLHEQLRQEARSNQEFSMNWQIVREWRTNLRYIRLSRSEARDMVCSVVERPNGVASWLSARAGVFR